MVYLEQHTQQGGETTIALAVMVTVLMSIFAHGLSARLGMDAYARQLGALPPDGVEREGMEATGPTPAAHAGGRPRP